jgi:hypothetical protein
MEYCKRSRISSFECATLTPSALYLTCECALIGTLGRTTYGGVAVDEGGAMRRVTPPLQLQQQVLRTAGALSL